MVPERGIVWGGHPHTTDDFLMQTLNEMVPERGTARGGHPHKTDSCLTRDQ